MEPTTSQLVEILTHIQECAGTGRLSLLETQLACIYSDPEPQSSAVMMTWLRGTSPLRDKLSNWAHARDAARAELDRRGLDTAKIMRHL